MTTTAQTAIDPERRRVAEEAARSFDFQRSAAGEVIGFSLDAGRVTNLDFTRQ